MTKINVRVVKPSYYGKVKTQKTPIKVSSSSGIIMARKLSDLMDVDTSNVQDNFIMQYDASSQKYKFYDPDELLSTALVNGLPEGFMDYLNENLLPERITSVLDDIYQYINNLTLGKLANVKESVDLASDTFIIRYDEVSGKYEAVDPDEILSSAIDESGLPQDFIDYLNDVLVPDALQQALNQLLLEVRNLTLGDLVNVDDVSVLDRYVLMYDSESETYKTYNPDEVLKAAVEETTEPGLPEEFLQQLDDDLDNRIDTDAGFF